jgi:hypothetical protein
MNQTFESIKTAFYGLDGNTVKISKIIIVDLKIRRTLGGIVKTCTIRKIGL